LTASIAAAENGWYCCTATISSTNVGVNACVIGAAPADNVSQYTGDGISGISIWGAQLELGSTATAYNNTSVRNLLGFSEAFDNAAWVKTRASIVTGAQANPVNGLFNAQKLMEDTTASNTHFCRQTFAVPANPITFSVYVKVSGRTNVRLVNASYGNAAYFTLTGSGSVGTTDSATGSISLIGDGWYRCSMTFTQSVAASVSFDVRLASGSTGGSDTYTGDGNSGVYIYGAMLSNSASLDPYVPTPGAAPSSTAYYGPRFDYDPVTLLPRGLLVEEARTNFLIYSDDLTNAAWTKSDATISSNSVVSPDGTSNADRATPSGATPIVRQTYTTSTVGAFTATVWLKSASATNVTISLRPTGAGSPVSVVCAVTTAWQRFPVSITTSAGITALQFWVEGFSQAIDVWGAQVEAGAFATSYIPTIASTVTRSADVATITGSLFSQWYNQSAGALIVDYGAMNGVGQRISTISDATVNNQIWLRAGTAGGNSFEVYTAGAFVAQINPPSANAGPAKIAGAFATNDFAASVNGSAVGTDTSGALASYNRMTIGSNFDATVGFLNGHIRSIRYVPVRAADFQLQQVTT
jgi:hypothetical protein